MVDPFARLAARPFYPLWAGTVALFLVLLDILNALGRRLATEAARHRIVSLELAGTAERTAEVLRSWGPRGVDDARLTLLWDFGFIFAYSLILAHGCAWAARVLAGRSRNAGGSWTPRLAWVAGACDVAENLCLLVEIGRSPSDWLAAAAFGFAAIKFALVATCGLYVAAGLILGFWEVVGAHVRFATRHLGHVVAFAMVYGLVYGLISTGNGIASLFWHDVWWIRLSAAVGATLLFLEVGVIVYYQQRDVPGGLVETMAGPRPWPDGAGNARENIEYLGRFLARDGWPFLAPLTLPALAPSLFPNVPWPLTGQSGPDLDVVARYGGSVTWLAGIALGALIARALIWSSRMFHRNPNKVVASPLWSVLVFLAIFAGVYAIASFEPIYGRIPPALAICALIGLVVMAYAVLFYFEDLFFGSLRHWWIPANASVLLALAVLVVVANNDPYKLGFPNLGPFEPEAMPDLKEVVAASVAEADPEMVPGGEKPLDDEEVRDAWANGLTGEGGRKPKLAIVTVSGGAVRSAYWVATVLQRLEETIAETESKPSFARHVRLISGASGGMLGAAVYVEELRRALADDRPPANFPEAVPKDSLTPVARWIALRESWRTLVPYHRWRVDRGVILEEDWTRLMIPIRAYAKLEEAGRLPSLVLSPMLVDDGRRLLISNLDLRPITRSRGGAITPEDPGLDDHFSSLNALEFSRLFPGAVGFRLGTAVRMSATFPFVSPAVNLPTDPPRRVVDAGYYDNYGVQIATAWAHRYAPWLVRNTSGVLLVQVRDSMSQVDRRGVVEAPSGVLATIGRSFQFFTSPLDGASRARYTISAFRNDQNVEQLQQLMIKEYLEYVRRVEKGKEIGTADLERASSFFTTIILENSAAVPNGFARPPGTWPGDEPASDLPSGDVSLTWYLSPAEQAAIDAAIPRLPTPAAEPPPVGPEPRPRPPAGSDWRRGDLRRERLAWLEEQARSAPGPDRPKWSKELERARNFEQLEQLKTWWDR